MIRYEITDQAVQIMRSQAARVRADAEIILSVLSLCPAFSTEIQGQKAFMTYGIPSADNTMTMLIELGLQ